MFWVETCWMRVNSVCSYDGRVFLVLILIMDAVLRTRKKKIKLNDWFRTSMAIYSSLFSACLLSFYFSFFNQSTLKHKHSWQPLFPLTIIYSASMDRLPQELLHIILKYAQSTSKQASFISCLLCCHLWYKIGRPLLHNGISLRNTNLQSFLRRFPSKDFSNIRLLTMLIEASFDDPTVFGPNQARRVQRLGALLPQMVNLSTFSFTFTNPRTWGPYDVQIPRSIIIELVENLPASCVSLEIDTNGLDFLEPHQPHLCDKLRHILPRLHHLRLRLADVCPGIFATGFNPDGTRESTITSVMAPCLKTAIINCCTGLWYSGACGIEPKTDGDMSLIPDLHDFASCGNFPVIERLWIIHRPHVEPMGPQYLSYQRCDIVKNQTWGIPFLPEFGHAYPVDQIAYLVRSLKGQEFLCRNESVIEQLVAEEQTWQTTLSKINVPAAVMMRWDFEKEQPLRFFDLTAYRITSCDRCDFHVLWRNERVTGLRLMGPVLTEGLMDDDRMAMMPKCPEGWRWVGNLLEPVAWCWAFCFFAWLTFEV